jgi:hypothetical protein
LSESTGYLPEYIHLTGGRIIPGTNPYEIVAISKTAAPECTRCIICRYNVKLDVMIFITVIFRPIGRTGGIGGATAKDI